jgi:hypothetical protein
MSYYEQIPSLGNGFERIEDGRRLGKGGGVSKGGLDGLGKVRKGAERGRSIWKKVKRE